MNSRILKLIYCFLALELPCRTCMYSVDSIFFKFLSSQSFLKSRRLWDLINIISSTYLESRGNESRSGSLCCSLCCSPSRQSWFLGRVESLLNYQLSPRNIVLLEDLILRTKIERNVHWSVRRTSSFNQLESEIVIRAVSSDSPLAVIFKLVTLWVKY